MPAPPGSLRDRILLEAVGGLFGCAGRDLQRFAEEDVLEGVLRTGGAVAIEQVDRARYLRARHLAPIADRAREDAGDGLLGDVGEVVLRAGDDADSVLGDLREHQAVGIYAGDRVARGIADVETAAGGSADADVGLSAADLRRGNFREGFVVGGRELLRQRQHRRRAADDQLLGEAPWRERQVREWLSS